MYNTLSFPLFLNPLWPGVVVPVNIAYKSQIEVFNHLTVCQQMTDVKLNCLCQISVLENI